MNKTGKLAIAFLCLVGGVLALVTAAARSNREPPVSIKPLATQEVERERSADWLTEYTLTQQSGEPYRSADLAGTPHVVNFFFASCPSYCRSQSMEVQKLAAEFGPQGVAFLSITCDPDNDTPAALQQYASMFNANTDHWKFLTGDMLLLRRVGAEMYEVAVDTQTHSEHLIVIDKWGQPRGRFRWQKHPEELAELKTLLPELLAETEPPQPAASTALVVDEGTGLVTSKAPQEDPEQPAADPASSPIASQATEDQAIGEAQSAELDATVEPAPTPPKAAQEATSTSTSGQDS